MIVWGPYIPVMRAIVAVLTHCNQIIFFMGTSSAPGNNVMNFERNTPHLLMPLAMTAHIVISAENLSPALCPITGEGP